MDIILYVVRTERPDLSVNEVLTISFEISTDPLLTIFHRVLFIVNYSGFESEIIR